MVINSTIHEEEIYGDVEEGHIQIEDEGVWMKGVEPCNDIEEEPVSDVDPWSVQITDSDDSDNITWQELTYCQRVKRTLNYILKPIALVMLLYFFVCSLDLLCSAFRLLGSKTAGQVFSSSEIMRNPIAGLMIGILCTVLVQSSSTSSSVIVSMVGAGILDVQMAIPIIMGANIGTSITNTLVSLAHSTQKDEFRRAFAGATVHDMFNWLTVIVLLPLEVATGYLYFVTSHIVKFFSMNSEMGNRDFLAALVKPITSRIVELDKDVLTDIALRKEDALSRSLIKKWCKYVNSSEIINGTELDTSNSTLNADNSTNIAIVKIPLEECPHLFAKIPWSDTLAGLILLLVSLALLIICLVCLSKLLSSMLRGRLAGLIKKTMNADIPGRCSFITGYLALVVGMGLTILVQSSSVFTSALTPLVGIGALTIERMYPLTLGSNIGTTTTGILAAMACPGNCGFALQIALCHLFFNLTGILLFYPIPCLRWPIKMAKILGNTTAEYRWFAIFYVIAMFFIAPAIVFGLSMAGPIPCFVVVGFFFLLLICVIIINVLQKKKPRLLPKVLQTWNFLPKCLHSLEPYDRIINKVCELFKCCKCCSRKGQSKEQQKLQTVKKIYNKHTSHNILREQLASLHKPTTHHVASDSSMAPLMTFTPKASTVFLESGYVTTAPTPSPSLPVSHAGSYIKIHALQF